MVRTFFLLFIVPFSLLAQSSSGGGLQLIHADRHIGKKVGNEQLRIFEGNVYFEQDTLRMWCDRAEMHEQKKRLDFYGHVKITDGKRVLRARHIEYYWNTRQAYCFEQVQIKGEGDSLFAQYFEYNFDTGKALARQDVFLFDAENLATIWGREVLYLPNEKFSKVTGQAHLMKIDSTSSDTLNIYARILQYVRREPKVAQAYDSVKIVQGKLKAVCDTAIYFVDEEKAILKHKPVAWFEDSELRAKKMTVYFDSLKLRRIVLEGAAIAKTLADSLNGEYDILKGKIIRFYIKNKKPERIIAIDNASSLYYITEQDQDQGANFATADTIKIFFNQGKLDSLAILGGAQGTYYPEKFKKEAQIGEH